jgi:hypothetical protein
MIERPAWPKPEVIAVRAALIVHGSPAWHYHGKGMLERYGGSTMEALPECWQKAKVIVESIGIFAAIGSALLAIFQYYRNNTLERFKNFLKMQDRFSSERVSKIINALRTSDFKSWDVSRADKDFLLGLFEEVLIMKNSNLITSDMAFYGFGAYAIEIYGNKEIFSEEDKEEPYWAAFVEFAKQADAYGTHFRPKISRF